jgi:D-3-phosphoglycerate dehydrogenase
MMRTIAITTSSFAKYDDDALQRLKEAGYTWKLNAFGRKLTEDEAIELLQDCVGVVAGTEQLSARVMEALPHLKIISRCGVGMDNVDLQAAADRGIQVCNTPYGPTLAVAELTLGLALDLLRHVTRMDRELRRGEWKKRMGYNLAGKRMGIIGFGRIGRAVADVFSHMSVEVAFCDPQVQIEDYKRMELHDLLAWADIISLHCSKTSSECYLIGEPELGIMPEGSWLINCSRGGTVDEEALGRALETGRLAGAALDVFENEPYQGPLKDLDNVILTPHIGSYAQESRCRMELDAVLNLVNALASQGGEA